MVLLLHVATLLWYIDIQEHVSWLCYSCVRRQACALCAGWHCSCVTRGQLNIIKQPVKLIRSVHCHLHFPFCVCRAPEPMGTLSLTSDPGLWAEPGVKMGSWGSPRGPWQTSGLLPQPHLNMNGIGIRRNFMNVDTENQSEFHWICPPLPALLRSAARNEQVQPSSPHWFK